MTEGDRKGAHGRCQFSDVLSLSPEVGTQVPHMVLCNREQYSTRSLWGPDAVRVTVLGNPQMSALPLNRGAEHPPSSSKRLHKWTPAVSRFFLFPGPRGSRGLLLPEAVGRSNPGSGPALPPTLTPSSLPRAGLRGASFPFLFQLDTFCAPIFSGLCSDT